MALPDFTKMTPAEVEQYHAVIDAINSRIEQQAREEVWWPLCWYPNWTVDDLFYETYRISSFGRYYIKPFGRPENPNFKPSPSDRINSGYMSSDGKHRLVKFRVIDKYSRHVGEAFTYRLDYLVNKNFPKNKIGKTLVHINSDPADCRVSNLDWV